MVLLHGGNHRIGGNMTTAETFTSPEIEKEFLPLLQKSPPDLPAIEDKLSDLERRFGVQVYSDFICLLCHLQFPAEDAKKHWNAILAHRRLLEGAKGRALDFRVALLDYFLSVSPRIRSPKVVEIRIFQKTQDRAVRDELTGLFNYRYLRQELKREIARCRRNGEPLSLAFFDLDDFKRYNDDNGHLVGDRALQLVSRLIVAGTRKSDLAFRYGGEEFAVLLPGANKAQACKVAERIRRSIDEENIGGTGGGARVTISGGVSTLRSDGDTPEAMLAMADHALYKAKGEGKNRIEVSSAEFRQHPRFEVRMAGRLQQVSGEPTAFTTLDVGERGFRFDSACPLKAGQFFLFTLEPSPQGEKVEGVAQVVRSRRSGSLHEIAARIVEMPAEQARRLKEHLTTGCMKAPCVR